MKKLIEALHVIQDECNKYREDCRSCPMYQEYSSDGCCVKDLEPSFWKINDEVQKALL